jgi:hypothetical protein
MNNMNPMQMLQMFQQSANPQAAFEMLLNKNPQLANSLMQLRNSTQGANPRDVALQLARQKGIPEEQVMQMFNSINR